MTELTFVVLSGDNKSSTRLKELQDSSARSHAARFAHQRSKLRKLAHRLRTYDIDGSGVPEGQIKLGQRDPSICEDETVNPDHNEPLLSPTTITTLVPGCALRTDRRDPFTVTPGAELPSYLHDALHFHYESYAATIFPPDRCHEVGPMVAACLQYGIEKPFLFHAQAVTAAGIIIAECQDTKVRHATAVIRAQQQVLSIQGISEEINKLTGIASDALILAILHLGYAAGEVIANNVQLHPTSPLANAQSLHIYGTVELMPQHVRALRILVKQKGGIDTIKLPGLRYFLEHCDLFMASRTDTQPLYPWNRKSLFLHFHGKHTEEVMAHSGDGLYLIAGLHPRLFELYMLATKIILTLDYFQQHKDLRMEQTTLFHEIAHARNEVQHGFLSIPRLPDPSNANHLDILICICRVCGLIFSDMALYPLPYSTGVKPRLAVRLRQALGLPQLRPYWSSEYTDLLMWACVLGAIAASRMSLRGWFLASLLRMPSARQADWKAFQAVMARYLWLDYVCVPPTFLVWKNLQNLKALEMSRRHSVA